MTACSTLGLFGSSAEERAKFASLFAKKSESQALEIYHRKGVVQNLLNPLSYPEKVAHFAKALTLCDFAFVFLPDTGRVTWQEAESVLGLYCANVKKGFFVYKKGLYQRKRLDALFAQTAKGYEHIEYSSFDELKRLNLDELCKTYETEQKETVISVDNSFNVKGVGLVALGFVIRGSVNVHDELSLSNGKTVEVKSMQVMDEDVEQAKAGTRVGLALKGTTEKELEQLAFLVKNDVFSQDLKTKLNVLPQYKKRTSELNKVHVALAGQLISCELKNENHEIALKTAVAIPKSLTQAVVFDLDQKPGLLRIVGQANFV
jgi:Selenocysteine-specific translation elongation factor